MVCCCSPWRRPDSQKSKLISARLEVVLSGCRYISGEKTLSAQRATANYVLGSADREHNHLIRQAKFLASCTRRLFVDAGIRPGMRILDLGSGVGDVAMLAATLVGPSGVRSVGRVGSLADEARLRSHGFLQPVLRSNPGGCNRDLEARAVSILHRVIGPARARSSLIALSPKRIELAHAVIACGTPSKGEHRGHHFFRAETGTLRASAMSILSFGTSLFLLYAATAVSVVR